MERLPRRYRGGGCIWMVWERDNTVVCFGRTDPSMSRTSDSSRQKGQPRRLSHTCISIFAATAASQAMGKKPNSVQV